MISWVLLVCFVEHGRNYACPYMFKYCRLELTACVCDSLCLSLRVVCVCVCERERCSVLHGGLSSRHTACSICQMRRRLLAGISAYLIFLCFYSLFLSHRLSLITAEIHLCFSVFVFNEF